MLKTKQMPKNTKKKLKKTKIIGGKNIADITLREKLKFIKHISRTALHDDVVNLVKYIDKEEGYFLEENIIFAKVNLRSKYLGKYITNTNNFIKYALLCLDDHNDNSYLLLNKKYENAKNYSDIFDDGGYIQNEAGLSQKADEYYTKFKTLVENIGKDNIIEGDKIFKDYMYDIYSDGIILLTVYDTISEDNLILYTKNSNKTTITKIAEIVNFFKVKRDCLIIKKYTYDTSYDNYLYDCMLQIINKLARTLLEKLDDSTLDKKGTFSKDALKEAVEEAKRKAEEEGDGYGAAAVAEEEAEQPAAEKAQLLQNVKILVNIIFNKYKDNSDDDNLKITRHSILLKSLKIIMLNKLGKKKEITFDDVDKIYRNELLKNSFNEDNINKIISSSIITYNILSREACTTGRRIESFQHIINAIYYENDENDENINMLKKLSSGIKDPNCNKTIDDIIKKRSYLISEANIRRLELETAYHINGSTFNLNEKINLFDDDTSLHKFNKYREDMAEHLKNNSINIDTRKKILLEYSTFKDNFNKYIRDNNKLKDILIPYIITP
jgi:hypothetical protein